MKNVTFASGVPEIVERDLHAARQCGDVERPVGELGAAVLGPAVLSPRLHPVDVVARRVPDPAECSPLRSRLGPPYQAALIACTPSPVADDRHEGVTKIAAERSERLDRLAPPLRIIQIIPKFATFFFWLFIFSISAVSGYLAVVNY